MKKQAAKKQKKAPEGRYKNGIVWLMSAAMLIFPFITFLKVEKLSGQTALIFPSQSGYNPDLFLYYKALFIIVCSLFAVLFFVGEKVFPDHVIKNIPLKDPKNRIFIILTGIYALFIILSAVFSKNKETVLMGSPGEYEGLFLLLSYCVLFLAGVNYFSKEKSLKIFLRCLFILMAVIVCAGLVEYLYKPIFEIPVFSRFIAPPAYREYVSSLKSDMFKNMIALTFHNPNYLGGFCALLFPLSIVMVKLADKPLKKGIMIAVSALFFAVLILSRSAAGFYSTVVSIIILAVAYRKELLSNIKIIFCYAGIFAAIAAAINAASGGAFLKSVSGTVMNPSPADRVSAERFWVKDVALNGGTITITGETDTLNIITPLREKVAPEDIEFIDKDGQKVIFDIESEGRYKTVNPKFKGLSWYLFSNLLYVDIGYHDAVGFYITTSGAKGIGQNMAVLDSISHPQNEYFKRYYGLATGRGYGWINTVPLLKNTIIIGRGPGNYALYFPQNDYVGLLNTHGTTNLLIDKPHNTYLQIAVNTGIISLLAVLAIFALSFIKGVKLCILRKQSQKTALQDISVGLFAGTTAFMIAALANDSIASVNPLFWLMLGINIGLYSKGHERNETANV